MILIVVKSTTTLNAKSKNKNISKKYKQQQSIQPRAIQLKTQTLSTDETVRKQAPKATLQTNHKIVKQVKKSETNKLIKRKKLSIKGKHVKGLYATFYSTRGKRFDAIIDIIKKTDLNSLVFDIKNEFGDLIYYSNTAAKRLPKANENHLYKDLSTLVDKVRNKNIYTIARIVVFKDNLYARTHDSQAIKNNDGSLYLKKDKMAWVDPNSKSYWKYILNIAKEAFSAGVDEVQFDYIRFPARSSKLNYHNEKKQTNKALVIKNFITFLNKHLKQPLSIDVFGLVGNVKDDLGIGQIWEDLAPQVDFISPMVYPSHYPLGFANIKQPDLSPYDTVLKSLKRSLKSNQKLTKPAIVRPWLQGFTAKWLKKFISYGPNELAAQIKALEELGIKSYLIWNPRSKYDKFFLLEQKS